MTARRRWLTAAYAALSVADTVAVGLGPRGRRLHHVAKPLLMPALAATLVDRPGPAVRPTVVAQGLSWGGDVALMGTSGGRFLTGVGSFLGAHLAYLAAFRAVGSGSLTATPSSRAVLALASVLVPVNAMAAGRRDARLAVPVGTYGIVLAAMGASAAGLPANPGRSRIRAGAALFLLSDSLLGAQLFLRDEPSHALESAVMATYTAGQWLISDGVQRSTNL